MRQKPIFIVGYLATLWVVFPLHLSAANLTVSPGGDIQAAINSIASSGGGTVSLTEGKYILSNSIQMKSNVTLEGVGTATRLELPVGATYAMIVDDGTEPCVNMTVRNMLLDGNIPESAVSHDPDYTDNPQQDCLGIFFDAYSEETYHQNVILENIEIHNTVDGCHIKGVNGGYWDNVYFHHNGIFYWPGHNSYLRRVQNYVVKNSRFEDSYNGSGVNCSWSENLVFTNCAVIRSEGRGIRNAASDGFVVHDCFIQDCGTAGIIANSEGGILTTSVDFRRNYVTGCGDDGITGGGSGIATDNNSFGNGGANYSLRSGVIQSGNISDSSIEHPFDSNEPFGATPHVVPGRIEAEEYDVGGEGVAFHDTTPGNSGGQFRSDDVDITTCSEGGYALTALEEGEWVMYTIHVGATGTYSFDVRYAAEAPGTIRFSKTGLNITGDILLPATGGSNTWATAGALENITLESGVHHIRIHASGAYQLNHIAISVEQLEAGVGTTLHVEAESRSAQNGTQLETCSDTGGGQNVAYISNNDWCQYSEVVLGAGGSFHARVARPSNKPDSTIEVWMDSLTGTRIATLSVPKTGGWQDWVTVEVDFPAVPGQHPLFLKFVESGTPSGTSLFNLNWFSLVLNPVEVEAEAFSTQSGIELEACSDVGGGSNVANINPGDWCHYEHLFIASEAVFHARVARPSGRPEGRIEIRANEPEGPLLGSVDVLETGGWQTYETIQVPLTVDPGTYSIYLKFVEVGTSTGRYLFNLNRFSITPSSRVNPPETMSANVVDADQIDLSWSTMNDASAFHVKRSSVSGGPYVSVGAGLTETAHSDSAVMAGSNYYYVVTAQYGSAESGNSMEVHAVPSIPLNEGDVVIDDIGMQTNGSGEQHISVFVEDSTLGHNYQVLMSESLTSPNWQPATDISPGSGGALTFDVPVGLLQTNCYYRLNVWRQ